MKKTLIVSLLTLILSGSIFSCVKRGTPQFSEENLPTVKEIHNQGALTLNELLLKHTPVGLLPEDSTYWRPFIPTDSVITKTGCTQSYVLEKNAKVFINIPSTPYCGYFVVDVHSALLKFSKEDLKEYTIVESPDCGYYPTRYKAEADKYPRRGGLNGPNNSGIAFFHTFYIVVKSDFDGHYHNRFFPCYPNDLVWKIGVKDW